MGPRKHVEQLIRKTLLGLAFLMVLSACGKKAEVTPLAPHEQVLLFNSRGVQGPEYLPELNGKFPFGVVVSKWQKNGFEDPGLCSATHIAPQWVLTAAHCITPPFQGYKTGQVLQSVSIVYYNTWGQASSVSASDAFVAGVPSESDVALLYLPKPVSDWDVWEKKREPFFATSRSPKEKSFETVLWSFDPKIILEIRDRSKITQGPTQMHFTPKRCQSSLKVPVIKVKKGDYTVDTEIIPMRLDEGEPWERDRLFKSQQFNTANFVYFDQCNLDWIPGNSGGLITMLEERELKPVAVATAITALNPSLLMKRWEVSFEVFSALEFEFFGPTKDYSFTGKDIPKKNLFAIGSRLELDSESSPIQRLKEHITALRFDTL